MNKKILAAIVAVVILLSPVVQPVPTAHAIFGVGDIVSDPFAEFTSAETWYEAIWNNYVGPALGSALKKQILDRIVDQLITSIQGGGKPQFVTDWGGFLADAEDGAAGGFIQSLGGGFLCSPFSLQIQLALFPVQKFYNQQAQCTLSKIVKNIQAFYGDFRNGGWLAYGTSWLPQNNFLGSLLTASEQLGIEKDNAAAKVYNEAMAGGGFLSTKKCDKDSAGKDIPSTCQIITPGSTVNKAVSDAIGADGVGFILSANDVGSYAGAIVSALTNRLFSAGLAAVKPSSNQNQLNTANAAYEASVVANAFNGEKSAVLAGINTTLGPRQQAQTLIDSTVAALNKFKTDLTTISNGLIATGKTTCFGGVTVSTVTAQIATEITPIDSQIAALLAVGAQNQPILDPLNAAVTEINAMTPTRPNINRMDEINGQIFPLLNVGTAGAFLSSVQATTSPINQNISFKTAIYNADLQQCQH